MTVPMPKWSCVILSPTCTSEMLRPLRLSVWLACEDLVRSTGLVFGLTRLVVTLPDFPLDLTELYEEPYEELDPDPAYERRELEPCEDDAPRVDEPPYCARPDPYEDDPYEDDPYEDDPYEDRDPYVLEPYGEPP